MPYRLLADAGAQTTIALALGSGATSFVGGSTANFPQPQNFGSGQASLTILDSGNPAWNPAAPLATPYEYAYYSSNNTGTNTISGLTRGVAGTTAKSFFAGATVAVGLLAEDLVASVPWKFDEQSPSAVGTVRIPSSGSIPASYLGVNYRHIQILGIARSDLSAISTDIYIQFHGDTGANYDWNQLYGNNNAAVSSAAFNASQPLIARIPAATAPASVAGDFTIDIIHAFNSVWAKHAKGLSFSLEGATAANAWNLFRAVHWFTSGTPIDFITLGIAGNFVTGSLITTHLIP